MINQLIKKIIYGLLTFTFQTGKYKFVFLPLLLSFIYTNKINFSAKSLETIIEGDVEKQIFKDNVIINKNSMRLFTDKAIYYPNRNEVILINNVKMYDTNDSLFCDSLILYDQDYKSFEAMDNIHFHQNSNQIKCEKLIYESLKDSTEKLIQIFDNGEIIDSLRTVKGDKILIEITYTSLRI